GGLRSRRGLDNRGLERHADRSAQERDGGAPGEQAAEQEESRRKSQAANHKGNDQVADSDFGRYPQIKNKYKQRDCGHNQTDHSGHDGPNRTLEQRCFRMFAVTHNTPSPLPRGSHSPEVRTLMAPPLVPGKPIVCLATPTATAA